MRTMRKPAYWALGCAIVLALAIVPWSNLAGGDATPDASRPTVDSGKNKFIVHEWGTFTNFAGANGVQLEFRPLADSELPGFVRNRARQHYGPFSKVSYTAFQRMETPVTYFYTDQPREVDVRVDFPKGLLTEFFPPVQAMGPAFNPREKSPLADSYLDWGRVKITPQEMFQEIHETPEGKVYVTAPPKVTGDNHYAFARETDSAIVEVTDKWKMKHYEKFLFYRGIGNFKLPLQFSALGKGRFEVTNFGTDPVESLFLVHIDAGRVWYSHYPRIAGNAVMYLEESVADSSVEALAADMVTSLITTGLYEKEARSMVKTWQSSWFGEEGTRLLYFVPPRLTDEVLPLKVSPQPDETVRVLVGRMEVFTPERAEKLVLRHS